ncbi:DUF1360 domain-containing protein [Mycobacterium yunnanensis]|uniref:DUF1360 domain-containing protein n=1 Tax=Mycobacterium yunnanensis TaxID=368477 RepID=A0A9X3BWH3_9MYCO|nr:DUF1360 domain-containing protein [Mycobacterium yunnanensis]MCV7424355.1 DUF1360 domain-containing protein [Mycobacterium yunnanensis]
MNDCLGQAILVLVVYALAVMRIVRLINADTILDPMRIAIARRARDTNRSEVERGRWSTVEYFTGCPWCVSMWVAAGTVWVPMWFAHKPVAQYVGILLAVSMIVGLMARFSTDEDVEIVES